MIEKICELHRKDVERIATTIIVGGNNEAKERGYENVYEMLNAGVGYVVYYMPKNEKKVVVRFDE